ncbi:MAG TPA: hypothetical protein VFR37_22315, partial [Longimicrobium sp.]|nr:hypothetical protein [Longimicrobium sp.]
MSTCAAVVAEPFYWQFVGALIKARKIGIFTDSNGCQNHARNLINEGKFTFKAPLDVAVHCAAQHVFTGVLGGVAKPQWNGYFSRGGIARRRVGVACPRPEVRELYVLGLDH